MGWLAVIFVAIVIIAAIARPDSKPKKRKRPPSRRSSRPTPRTQPSFAATVSVEPRRQAPKPIKRRSSKDFDIRWFGRDDELKVSGLTLRGPCVYASSGPDNGYLWAKDPSEILLQADVNRSHGAPVEMGYWPWYSRIEPGHRFEYLSWLASGRASLPQQDGYLFLYFYGIERRLLIDEADRAWALQEIVRLRKLDAPRVGTSDGRSFRGYSTGLLWFELARTPALFDDKAFNRVVNLTERWTPELLTAPLAWVAERGRPLPAWLARQIAASNPSAQRSVVTKRIPEEFNDLFEARYRDEFGGDGINLKVSKRPKWHTYRPASGGLEEMRVQVVNPLGIRSQFKKLPDIWNSCIADLRKLSRVSASVDGGALTVDAWEAMPEELRADVDHPLAPSVGEVLTNFASNHAATDEDSDEAGPMMAPAGKFAELLGIERRPKLTASQSRKVATTIEHTGYGIVPDARISPIRYGWDQLVAVVPGLDGDSVESARYNAAACVLRLGLAIVLADGRADDVELRVLTDHIDAVFDLSTEEQQRISTLRGLLLRTGSDIAPIARKVQEMLPADARRKVGRLLVVIAAATDGIDRSERTALRKAFRALDLAPEVLDEAIADVAPESDDGDVRVRPAGARRRQGEAMPAPASGFTLDHAAISTIMSETREVSLMLAEAMGAADAASSEVTESDIEPASGADVAAARELMSGVTPATAAGPSGRYGPLFMALIERERWRRDDADGLARAHGLMLDAGVETINDWSFDALGAPLIHDEGDDLIVDRALLDNDA